MRFVDAQEIRRLLTFPLLVDALEAAHRRPPMQIQDSLLGSETEQYFVRHAVDPGRYMASKLITSFPGNLTAAADSALGAKILAPPEPRTLLIVGAGEMSVRLVHAHRTVRPSLQRVLIWNRTPERAAAVAAGLAAEGIESTAVDDLAAATGLADVISTCTRSHEPLVLGARLKAGVQLRAARRALVFVDRRESAFHGVGDILQPIASGAIREVDVLGDLHDLVSGSVRGRRSSADITFYKNAGGGHLDLMTAELVFRLSAGPGELPRS